MERATVELTGFGEVDGVELLQKLALFSQLSFDETSRLAKMMMRQQVPAGAVVIEQDALSDALFIVHEGLVKVSRDVDLDGAHRADEELGRLGVGEVFGEMSLVDDVLTSARVTALVPCKLLKLPRREFQSLLESDDRFALKVYRSFCRTLSDRLRRANTLMSAKAALSMGIR